MDPLISQFIESSPIAGVAIFTIWRMSIVMISLVDGFVNIATAQSDTVTELVENRE